MRYFLDTEFNGFNGELLSLALIRNDSALTSLYVLVDNGEMALDPWVRDNVLPHKWKVPAFVEPIVLGTLGLACHIEDFLKGDKEVEIVTDWPDDISYFCKAVITNPGEMISTFHTMRFRLVRVDSYPTTLADAVQHNAWWDAMALRQKLIDENYWEKLAVGG